MSGCANVGSVYEKHGLINYADGIGKKEAVVIAQHFLLNHPSGKYFVLSAGAVHERAYGWEVVFSAKPQISRYNMTNFYIQISDRSGGILEYKVVSLTGGAPLEFKSYRKED